jgi:hypothetical protein
MITRLTLRNFKSVDEQVYDFSQFDLLVGRNNCGKSTVLQALAIWQFCVDEFHRSRRGGSKGIQVVLPNFTALPLPEFILLWKDRTDRAYPFDQGKQKKVQEFILIEIVVEWRCASGTVDSFGVQLRYHSPQTMYAIPSGGWETFRKCEKGGELPRIAYVPPFSGLEPAEKYLDISPIRQQVGKGQPGSVLRKSQGHPPIPVPASRRMPCGLSRQLTAGAMPFGHCIAHASSSLAGSGGCRCCQPTLANLAAVPTPLTQRCRSCLAFSIRSSTSPTHRQ